MARTNIRSFAQCVAGRVGRHGKVEVAPESGREHRCFVFKRGEFLESILDENCSLWGKLTERYNVAVTGEIHGNTGMEKCQRSGVWKLVSRHWLWAIIVLGLELRLAQYVTDRSLWYDEALLALNVLHRPTVGLFKPLEYHQGAPVGFLLLAKLATKLAGHGELALRAFPLAFGIFGLLFFWRVASLYVSPRAVPVALSLFAFCGSLIYYSSETKQYSGDVAVTVMLLWLVSRLACRLVSTAEVLGLSLAGGAAIWFSHTPQVFCFQGPDWY